MTGGIEKVCRSMAKALVDIHPKDATINVMSLHDIDEDFDQRYLDRWQFEGFAGNSIGFISKATFRALKAQTVILSHINLLPVALLIKCLSPCTRIILLAHGIEIWRALKSWQTRFLRKSCEIWAVSNFTSNMLQEKHQIPADNIKILNNCLDPFFKVPEIKNRPDQLVYKHGIFPTDPILLTLTRLSSTELYKGYDIVLRTLPEILKIHPTLLYFIAGKADNEEQERLEGMIEELNLQNNVILLGFIPEEMVSAYFQLADIFIMPSREEGFGLVFIEAAACGTRIIAGNKDGSRDALIDGKLGTLVDPQNEIEIVNAVFATLSNSIKISPHAIQKICTENFGYSRYKHRIMDLLRRDKSESTKVQKAQNSYQIVPVS